MELALALVFFGAGAVIVHVARYWRPLAFVAAIAVPVGLLLVVRAATDAPYEFFGTSFILQPLARDYLLSAVVVSGVLAFAMSLGDSRRTLGFLFWSWTPWFVTLAVNDFVVGVFAWATGLAALVIAMEPQRHRRVGGAAYFLVLVIIASALLLIGHRFIQLYPLTPDQTGLIDSAVLFLIWGLGILLAVVPFILWLGPMADETPLPIIAVLLGMGQPLGLWLLYELIGQYPRLLELSNLLTVLGYGGLLAIAVGGSLAALERRAGRLLSYASLYVMGFVLLDLARGTLASTAYGVVELFTRALGLALVAASVSLARSLKARGVRFAAVPVFILGMLTLAGLVPGVSLASRWNLLLELEATDRRAFVLVLVATLGVLIGTARFVMLWLRQIIPLESVPVEVQEEEVDALPPELPRLVRARAWVGAQLRSLGRRIQSRIPSPVQRLGRNVTTQWRAVSAMVLLATLTAFALYYSALPQVWLDRALETVGQLAFLR